MARSSASGHVALCFAIVSEQVSFSDSALRAKLVPKRLRLVHARTSEPARLALVELRPAKPGGLVVEPPLIEWLAPRVRSPALEAIVAGRFGSRSA